MKQSGMQVINGVRLNVMERGVPGNPCLVFLHGFPDFHHGWRHQAHFFEKQNYHVITPDQRGYNLSEKPKPLDQYSLDVLAQDIQALIKKTEQQVWLIGHNWGGKVAWRVAQKYPDLLKGLILLNAPHPEVYQQQLKAERFKLFKQAPRFAYQIPGLMENVYKVGNWMHFSQQFQKNARKGTITQNDLKKYREAWSQPGAIASMINWQRAFARKKLVLKTSFKIEIPTLFIHGMQDKSLTHQMVINSLQHCIKGSHKQITNAGHWAHLDQHQVVNDLIFNFINQSSHAFSDFAPIPITKGSAKSASTQSTSAHSGSESHQLARQMKADGLSQIAICKYTGLSKKEVRKL